MGEEVGIGTMTIYRKTTNEARYGARFAIAPWLSRHFGDRVDNRPRSIPTIPLEFRDKVWYTLGVPLPHFSLFFDHQNAVRTKWDVPSGRRHRHCGQANRRSCAQTGRDPPR